MIDGADTGGWEFSRMLRPDLPKENIDGEAVLVGRQTTIEPAAKPKKLSSYPTAHRSTI